jgi:hypothetical protein
MGDFGDFEVEDGGWFWYQSASHFFSRDREVSMAKRNRTDGSRKSSPAKKAARKNDVSPEVAARLAVMAREMRQLVYGEGAVPEWGTKFTEIESEGMNLGLELAREFMEQSVGEQAGQVPNAALECDGEVAEQGEAAKLSTLETPAGEVEWEQPQTRLSESGRAFFPSGEGFGDQR